MPLSVAAARAARASSPRPCGLRPADAHECAAPARGANQLAVYNTGGEYGSLQGINQDQTSVRISAYSVMVNDLGLLVCDVNEKAG
jgi:hypothetical protein